VFDDLGLRLVQVSLSERIGMVELLAGDPRAAEVALRRGYEIASAAGDAAFVGFQAGLLAEALIAQDRFGDAEPYAHESEVRAAGDIGAQMGWRRTRAKLESVHGRHEHAIELGREAVEIAAGTDALTMHGDALVRLAEILRAAGRDEDAAATALRARELYERKGNVAAVRAAASLLAAPAV
jgi:tetratricopeptide (TPR) repeat protein